MEIKVLCSCGAKYQFPVEPVNGQLPRAIACPVCGLDNTRLGNQAIQEALARPVAPVVLVATPIPSTPGAPPASAVARAVPPPPPPPPAARPAPPPPPPPMGGLRVSTSAAAPPPSHTAPSATPTRVPTGRYSSGAARARISSGASQVKRVVTGITSAILVVMGIWVVYKKVKRNFNTAAGIVETLSGEDSTVRWTLPADTASVFLVKHQNHTNVAEVLNAVNFKLQGKRLKMEGTTESIVEDGRFFVSPSYKGAVEVNGLWDWSDSKQEAEAMSFASELSRQLNTLVVVALMGDDTESGVYAVFENGERRFRMKRWYRITSLRQGDLKEFVERDGVEWAKQHGYVPDPDDVLTGDNDAISFGDVNELTLKLGIDLSDAPDDQISLVLRDSAPASPAQPKASSQKH